MSDTIFESAEFLTRIHAGDHDAFVIVWRTGWQRLRPFYTAIGLLDEAEDLWAETITKLFRSKCSLYDPKKSTFISWIMIVGKRVAFDRLRNKQRHGEVSIEGYENDLCIEVPTEEEIGGSSELRTLVRSALESLEGDDRTIISQRFVENLPFELIAENLRISVPAVYMRVSRARKRLQHEFERLGACELQGRIRRPQRRDPP